jgi:predicted transcriptional regulator
VSDAQLLGLSGYERHRHIVAAICTDELVEEAVGHFVAYNERFEAKVKLSLPAAERGNTVPDEEVRVWLERPERS